MSSTHIGEHKESGVGPGDTLEHASHRDIIHLALSPQDWTKTFIQS